MEDQNKEKKQVKPDAHNEDDLTSKKEEKKVPPFVYIFGTGIKITSIHGQACLILNSAPFVFKSVRCRYYNKWSMVCTRTTNWNFFG